MSRRRRILTALASASMVAVVFATPATARPGDPDPAFSDDGVAVIATSARLDSAAAVAVQPDGRVLLVGTANLDGVEADLVVTRLDADGSLDEGFATGGTYRLDLAGPVQADDVAVDGEGRVVVGGRYTNGAETQGVVVRLLPDGRPDRTFDADGLVRIVDWPIDPLGLWRIALRPDDHIMFAGPSLTSQIVVGQLAPDGSLDLTFGVGGYATYGLGSVGAVRPTDLFVDQLGRPTVAADTDSGGTRLARFTADGLGDDPEFDVEVTTVGIEDIGGATLLELPNALGLVSTNTDGRSWGITVLDRNGGFMGYQPLNPFPGDQPGRITGAAVQPDGRVVAVGYEQPSGGGLDPYLARIGPGRRGWALDPSFGVDGVASSPIPGDIAGLNGVEIAPDGSVVAVGSAFFAATRTDSVAIRLQGQTSRCDGKLVTVDLRIPGARPSAGDDVIVGTRRSDVIRAGRGNDTVCGGRGADIINGGAGTDRCLGGRGRDTIRSCE